MFLCFYLVCLFAQWRFICTCQFFSIPPLFLLCSSNSAGGRYAIRCTSKHWLRLAPPISPHRHSPPHTQTREETRPLCAMWMMTMGCTWTFQIPVLITPNGHQPYTGLSYQFKSEVHICDHSTIQFNSLGNISVYRVILNFILDS